MRTLEAYVPIDRRHALYRHAALPNRVNGAALFADISGFTPLTSALADELGRKRGAEQVLNYINPVFEAIITQLHLYGGSVISFAGDAITCWFEEKDNGGSALPAVSPAAAVLRAVACGLAMQTAMQQFATVYTPAGTPVTLGIKVAVAAGPARRFLVGNPAIQTLEAVAGSTLERMAAAEHQANKGEVMVDGQTFEQLSACLLQPPGVLEWRANQAGGQRFVVLGELPVAVEHAPWPPLPPDALPDALVRPWLLPVVFDQLCSGGGFFGDLRPVSSLFLRFGGIDYDGDDQAGEKLDAYINWVQAVVHQHDGALLQVTIGDKGSNLFVCFGAPLAHEDDPYRVAAVALALQNPPLAFHFIEQVQIGITRGEAWAGACGAAARHYYGVLGNEVNMAARLMTAARPGQILVSQMAANITADRFSFRALADIRVKGRAEPLAVVELGGEREPATAASAVPITHLVGRQAECSQLSAALAEVEAGQSRIICLEGEAGIGKSRLLAAFLSLAEERGWTALHGTGQSVEQHTPYRAWRDVLGMLFGLRGGEDAAARLEQAQQRAAQLAGDQAHSTALRRLPLLNDILHLGLPDNDLTAFLPPDLRQQSLTMLVQTLLQALAGQRPLCLALDDVQWLDALSWELTTQIARGLQFAGHPVLLLLATRPLGEQDAGARSLASLLRLPGAQTLAVTALQREEIVSLAAARLGLDAAELPAELADLVFSHSDGNPLFAEELVFSLREQGIIQIVAEPPSGPAGRRCTIQGDLAHIGERLSDTLQGVILARMDRLPPERRAALKMAAVIGRSFAYPTLQHTLKVGDAIPDETLLAHLKDLIEQDLILPQTPQPGLAYVFKHIITQEVAYQTLLFDQRKRIHQKVAEWYEATFSGPGQLSPYLPLLVYHYQHAEDAEKERRYARLAGEQAAQQAAHKEAVVYFSRALALTPAVEPETRFELLLAREQAYDRMGARLQQAQDLAALAGESLALAQPIQQAQVALRQANYAEAISDYPAASAAAERAIVLAQSVAGQTPEAGELLAGGHTAWGEALRFQGDYASAQLHMEQAVACLRPLHARRALATALRKLGIIARNRGEMTLAAECYAEALALSRAAHDLEGEAAALNNLGTAALKQAMYAQAQAHFQPALKLYQELGDRRKEAGVLNNLALVEQAQGAVGQAQASRQQALSVYRQIGDRQGEAMVLTNLGSAAARAGNYEQARAYHQQALTIHREIGDRPGEAGALNNLGLAAVAQNDLDQAQTWFEQALAIYQETGSRPGEANASSNLGALAEQQGDLTRAQTWYRRALEIYHALGNQQRETALTGVLAGMGS